jgi:Na+/citrate or Na+/malate symporter
VFAQTKVDPGKPSSPLRESADGAADGMGSPYIITIVATVVAIISTGFFVGGWLKIYPIAQIATRIGGAITVTLVLVVLTQIG